MDNPLYLSLIAGSMAIFGVWIAYNVMVQGSAWRNAVAAIAQKHKLTYVAPEGAISKKFDLAYGNDRGVSVQLGSHSVSRGDSDSMYAKIEASGAPSRLKLIKPGSYDKHGITDYSRAPDEPVKIGVAEFDASVEVRGASPKVLDALRHDPVLRAEITTLMLRGLEVSGGDVVVISSYPKKASVIEDRYERVVSLALKLKALG